MYENKQQQLLLKILANMHLNYVRTPIYHISRQHIHQESAYNN